MFKKTEDIERFILERKKYGIKPGLKRIKKLLLLLDNPQDKVPSVHIAGTNGKGSTINFLKQSLQYNGYKVGVFTSPSLESLTEHIHINDDMISKASLTSLMNDIYPFILQLDKQDEHPTEFEIITALAFYYFVNTVDITLIETGMGGKDDTTNCFQPILSIITNIDKDHTGFLGESLEEIARHKAGIIKFQAPVVIGELAGDALLVIKEVAANNKADVYELGKDFTYEVVEQTVKQTVFKWRYQNNLPFNVSLQMLGEHQIKNCSLALMSLDILSKKGYQFDREKTIKGIFYAQVMGRLEVIHHDPLIVLDGAHNPAGIKAFIKGINDYFPRSDKHLLFAAFKDKDIQQMLSLVKEHFTTITMTSFDHERAASTHYLVENIDSKLTEISDNWMDYLKAIDEGDADAQYFITGSLDFIGRVREYLIRKESV